MDKLYAIKIRQSDGTYGAAIPVSVLAENVDWNSTLSLVDILGQVDTSESIQDQINNLKNTRATQASVNALDQKVDNAVEYITHNSEIADARQGADGTEYSTLKERLDSEYITHNSEIADAREGADGTEYSTLKERLDSEYNNYQEDVDTIKDDVDILQENVIVPYLFIPYLDARYNPAGNCFAFIFENRCTLIDLGRYECFGTMSQQLIDKGVDTIDNIVITHWHGDHDSMLYSVTPDHAYDHLKTAFNCTNTKFYIPREAPAGFDADTGYAGITSSFSSENITILDNNTAFVWEGISFSVKNQSDEDYAHYVSIGTTDLNECSAIVYAEYKDFVFLDSGDICVNAQQRAIAQGYIKEANLLNVPHHGVNNELCTTFTGCINPQYAYVANNVPSLRYGNRDGIIWQAGLTATIFDNVNNKNGVEIHFNHGVTAKGIPLINSGYNLSSHLRTIYVSENVQVGDIQDGTQQHPYKDIAYVCSLCKGLTVIELLSDITVQAQFSNLTGSVTIHGNNHSLNGINVRFNGLLQLENVTLNGGSFIEFSWVFFYNVTFASTMNIYRSFINANNCTVNNVKFAENLNYSFVSINAINGTVGNNNYLVEVPYYSYVNINGNATGKNLNTNNMFCVINDHTGLNTKYLMDNVRENLAASVNVTKFTKSFTLTNGSTYLLIASHSSGGVAVHAITTYGNAILIANVSTSSFVHLTTSGLNLTVSTDWPVTVSLNKLT